MKDKARMGKVIFSFSCSANANPEVTSYQLFENKTAILNTSAPGMWSGALKSEGVFVYKCANANPEVTSYQLFENKTAILNTSAPGMWSGALKSEGVFVYKCVANNSLGSEYSMNVTVTVSGKQISPFCVGLGTI